MNRGRDPSQEPLERGPPLPLRRRHEVATIGGEQVEGDERRRRLPSELLHPRRRRVQALLQGVEVEPVRGGDHDLAVHHAVLGQAVQQRLAKLREVAVERPGVAALDVEVGAAPTEHDGAEAVPLGLEEEVARFRKGLGQRGEHGLDRGGDGEVAVGRGHGPIVQGDRGERNVRRRGAASGVLASYRCAWAAHRGPHARRGIGTCYSRGTRRPGPVASTESPSAGV